MKFKTSVSLMVAVVMGLVTAYVGVEALKKSKGGSATKVVVAARDMDPGYVVEKADLKLEEVPANLAPSRSFKDPALVAGRTVLASVVKGYPLLDNQLAAAGAGSGMQAMVPKGMRAVAVEVSEGSAVAGLITPGCFVDVIATLRQGEQNVAATVVHNVKVQFVQRARPTRSVNAAAASGTPDAGAVKTVTLIVTPKQANALELANSQGKPRLVLRGNGGEDDSTEVTTVNERELLGLPAEEPVVAPPPPPVVEKPAVDESTFENAPPPEPVANKRGVQIIRSGNESMIYFDDEGNQKEGNGAVPASQKESPKEKRSTGNGVEPRTASGASPDDQAPRTDAGRGNLR
jgi:pilus assembly protein CpaB